MIPLSHFAKAEILDIGVFRMRYSQIHMIDVIRRAIEIDHATHLAIRDAIKKCLWAESL